MKQNVNTALLKIDGINSIPNSILNSIKAAYLQHRISIKNLYIKLGFHFKTSSERAIQLHILKKSYFSWFCSVSKGSGFKTTFVLNYCEGIVMKLKRKYAMISLPGYTQYAEADRAKINRR